jgi:hypothetical protein
VPNFRNGMPGFAVYFAIQAVLNALPPAVLAFVLFRNPPPGLGVDATAGMTIASIVFRVLFYAWFLLSSPTYRSASVGPAMFLRFGAFTALEAGITVLALVVRKRLGPMNPGALVLAVVGFLFWEGILQTVMSLLARMIY